MTTWKVYSTLVTIIIIIIGLCTVPIILFYTLRQDDPNKWKEIILESLTPHIAGCLSLQGNWSNSSACRANGTANGTSVQVKLDCHPDFVQLCGVCTPRCATIDLIERSGAAIRVEDITTVLAYVLGFIYFIVFLIMTVIRRKHMYVRP